MVQMVRSPWELSTLQVVAAVSQLEGVAVPRRTIADLPRQGLVSPSIRWDRRKGRAHACIWSLDDLVKIRLIVRLRRTVGLSLRCPSRAKLRRTEGLSMQRLRRLLRLFGPELRAALRPDSRIALIVDSQLGVVLRDLDTATDFEPEKWQFRLPLASLYDGAERVAAEVLRAA